MFILVAGLIVFLGVHLFPAVLDWRVALVRHWGEQRYKGFFSLVSFAGFGLIIAGYASAPRDPLLFAPSREAIAIAPYAMALSFALFAAANLRGHIGRLVRHPMLLGLGIWAGIHLLANRDARETLLFGAFLAYAAVDLISAVQRHATKHLRSHRAP